MRVAVYGGSFHPPHVGHAMVAAWLGWTRAVDEVWLVPVGAHAFGKALPPHAVRMAWCEALAADVGPWVRACAIEGGMPTPSYTIDTLDRLAALHPGYRFQLVVGSDVLADTPRWRQWDRIQAEYAPIIVSRGGYELPGVAPVFPEISSTAVRAALAEGGSVEALVPGRVLDLLPPYFLT